ncbi:disease resistance protein At4g27190-like [Vicia villosa]|uniref:disease resistance protein At4g27190-like n=1 Tax=Vicia villosa TaxID=3911 RepID=UPI00273B6114|nr:disease resistance protein At4g27190-like [Vicia villosa]
MESCLDYLGKSSVEKFTKGALAQLRSVYCFTCISNEFKEEKFALEGEIKAFESLSDDERFLAKDYIPFPSRELKYKELLEALKDDNNNIIGLQGMGGIGKTTLTKKVIKELTQSAQFTHVIDIKIPFTSNVKKIQDDIARCLKINFEGCIDSKRSETLLSEIYKNDEKILLIMDDVWYQEPPLDFDLIGIPKQDKHKGCKVLITTQSKQWLQCDKMIELKLLSEEESWIMFKTYADIRISSLSKKLIEKSRKISKECKQLPIAIAVIASNLKSNQHSNKWDDTLKSLKKHVEMDDVDEEKVGVYQCFKSSYKYIWDKKAKGLFLLSSLFPLDMDIPVEILVRLSFGTRLFEESYDKYNNARVEVYAIKNKLIDSCLLLRVTDGHVKMHDLVREMAQRIANNEIQSVNFSDKDKKSSLERKKDIKYLFCIGKDKDLFSCEYDGSKLQILVVDMESDEDTKCMEVLDSFFENIAKLQVLYVLGHENRALSLPKSIHSLANIRSILIDGVDLGDILVLGNLDSLETLDLDKCKINELPQEIANFKNFRFLHLKECKIGSGDPFEVIKKCSTLEELYFIDSFNNSCREITLPQLKLKRYRIGKKWQWSRDNELLSKCVAFTDHDYFLSKETYKYCMQTSDGLQLNGISIKVGWRNLIPEIVDIHQGMNDLVELHMREISQLECLIDLVGFQDLKVLSKLAVLKLDEMKNLKLLINGSLSFESLMHLEELSINCCITLERLSKSQLNLCNLKKVTLRKCQMLDNPSSLLTSRKMKLLEKLEIVDCEKLTKIIDERGEKELGQEINNSYNDNKKDVSMFPNLKFLFLEGCQLLESIFPLLSSQDLPVLEDITIRQCDKLKYIFRKCQHVELGSLKHIFHWQFPKLKTLFVQNCNKLKYIFRHHVDDHQNHNGIHLDLQALQRLHLCYLPDLLYVYPNKFRTTIPHLKELQLKECFLANANTEFLKIWKRAQCLPLQANITRNVKEMTLYGVSNIKSMFMLSITSRMLVETLRIQNCDELKHIIVDIGDDDECGLINWVNVFPKLKKFNVQNRGQLEYIFDHYTEGHRYDNEIHLHLPTLESLELEDHQYNNEIHLHLPSLQSLELCNLQCLVAMCPNRYRTTFSSLKELKLVKCSLDIYNIIMKDLSGSMEHGNALESPVVHNLHDMACLQNLTQVTIVEWERMEIAFSTSIFRCLSQLAYLRIENCKELKHIIQDDRQIQNLSNITCFPKLKMLVIIKCHKLKCVFSVSICKELPRLETLIINEANELEEIFKSEGDQKVEIPNLKIVVLVDLPRLQTQEKQFQTTKNRLVKNCPKLSFDSTTYPFVWRDIKKFSFEFEGTHYTCYFL